MTNAIPKSIMLGAGLFLTIALIGLAVMIYGPSTEIAKTATTEFSETTSELKDQKYLIYDNTVISGSQVVNAIRKFQKDGESGDIAIHVITGRTYPSGVWYYNTFSGGNGLGSISNGGKLDISGLTDSTSDEYVNPSGIFKARVLRDDNMVIRAIIFEQE